MAGFLAYIMPVDGGAGLRPDQGLPPVSPGVPSHPIWGQGGAPDQGLPGGGGYPDQGLPGSGARPDQGLPGGGLSPQPHVGVMPPPKPDKVDPSKGAWLLVMVQGRPIWAWGQGSGARPDQGLPPTSPGAPDQGLPPGSTGSPDQSLPPVPPTSPTQPIQPTPAPKK